MNKLQFHLLKAEINSISLLKHMLPSLFIFRKTRAYF